MPDVHEVPSGFDADIDVHAAVAGGLGEADQPQLLQQLARRARDTDGVRERRTGLGVEVDAQLVGAVDVGTAYGPGVEGDRAHLGAPDGDRDLGGADLLGGAAGGEGDLGGLEIGRRPLGDPLLVERVRLLAGAAGREGDAGEHARRPSLERGRTISERAHQPLTDGREEGGHHQLGDLGRRVGRRVDHPVGAGDPDRAITGLDLGGGSRHALHPYGSVTARQGPGVARRRWVLFPAWHMRLSGPPRSGVRC